MTFTITKGLDEVGLDNTREDHMLEDKVLSIGSRQCNKLTFKLHTRRVFQAKGFWQVMKPTFHASVCDLIALYLRESTSPITSKTCLTFASSFTISKGKPDGFTTPGGNSTT